MRRITKIGFVLTGVLLLASSGANGQAKKKADLSRLVVLGDSLSAGFQNFSLYSSDTFPGVPPGGQKFSFATMIAQQAGASLTLPIFSYPGIPPALKLTPTGVVLESGIGQRINLNEQATNLSVPGFSLSDAISHPFPGDPANAIDALSALILGFPQGGPLGCGPIPTGVNEYIVSQITCGLALKPTTILLSIGNNDALQSLTFGLPPTNPQQFKLLLTGALAALSASRASIVLANIPDVTTVPFLVPAPAFQQLCGFLPVGATAADFAVVNLLNPAGGMNLCANYSVRSAALIQQTRDAVRAYNQAIAAVARIFGATVVDINALFNGIAQNGYVVGNRTLTAAFLGGLFSLDAIHPTNTGYAILANEWIKTMNGELKTKIPLISLEQVAAADPLVLPVP